MSVVSYAEPEGTNVRPGGTTAADARKRSYSRLGLHSARWPIPTQRALPKRLWSLLSLAHCLLAAHQPRGAARVLTGTLTGPHDSTNFDSHPPSQVRGTIASASRRIACMENWRCTDDARVTRKDQISS